MTDETPKHLFSADRPIAPHKEDLLGRSGFAESLSAFANRTGGGVLLFGLDEEKDFSIVGVGNVQRLQEELTHLASAEMEPALRPQFVVDEINGETVICRRNRRSRR